MDFPLNTSFLYKGVIYGWIGLNAGAKWVKWS